MAKDRIELISRAVIRSGSWLLACRDKGKGYLYLPGGHVEFGESAGEAVLRELGEEAGLEGRVLGCMLVCEVRFEQGGRARHEVNVVFHVEPTPPTPTPAAPTPTSLPATSTGTSSAVAPAPVESREAKIGFEWVDLASVVELDFRPRLIKAWLVSGFEPGYAGGGGGVMSGVGWLSDSE